MDFKPKLVTIIGPTACGKSALAVEIAKACNGEIVSADSRQFYLGMNIGTAKITKDEMQGVPHHLVDFLTPDQAVSVFDFQKRAFEIIDDIIARGKTPLLVGGTGFYISAVIENYQLRPGVVDQKLRDELNALTLEALQERVKEFNPPLTLDIKNKVRIVRFIENKLADASYEPTLEVPKYDVLIIEPEFDREMLNKRINARVKLMFENGLVGEVAGLVDKYGKDAPAFNAIGYREFLPYNNLSDLKNDDLSAIREEIAINSRHYAKRQITWFRRYLNKYIHKDLSTTLLKVHFSSTSKCNTL